MPRDYNKADRLNLNANKHLGVLSESTCCSSCGSLDLSWLITLQGTARVISERGACGRANSVASLEEQQETKSV